MKKLFKWLFRLMVILVLLVLGLILFLDPIAKSLAEREIRAQTGLGVKIEKLSIGLRTPTITVLNFKLFNSSDFGGSLFVDISELRIQYDLQALRSRKVHLNLVRANLAQLHIVQDKRGRNNLQALQERQKQRESTSGSSAATAEFEGIDTLKLSVGKLRFTSESNPTNNEEIYVGLRNETLNNVKSWQDLEPLMARIRLEKDVKFLSDDLFKRGTNVLQTVPRPAEKEAPKALEDAPAPPKR